MASKIKKLFVVGSLVSGLFMAIAACDKLPSQSSQLSNQSNTSLSENSSSNQTSIDSSIDSLPSSSTSGPLGGGNSSSKSSSSEVKVVLESISAISKKESYEWGEELDINVYAKYSDGSSKEVKDYQVSGFNNKVPGEQNVVITYQDKTCTIKVKVNDPILTSITAVSNKAAYEWNEDLDLTVTAHYSDNSQVNVTEYDVEGFDNKTAGEQNVTVKYQNKTCSVKVTVNNPKLENIRAISNKESYEWGEELDIKVIAHYADNSDKEVTGYKVEGFNNKVPGEQTLTITFEEKTCELKVTVNNPVLVSITAISNKESYEYGENLDLTVKAHYSDESEVAVTEYQVEGYNSHQPGEQTITITFENKSCELKVTVNERIVSFPQEELDAFLNLEGIKTEIPTPAGNLDWESTTDFEQDGSKYFLATVEDKGTVGSDSIADQYKLLLENEGWTVTKNGNKYTANKANADAIIIFSTENSVFSLRVESYTEFPTSKVIGSLLSSKGSIKEGMKVIFGSIENEYVAVDLKDGKLTTEYQAANSAGPDFIAKYVTRFTISKNGDYWQFTDAKGRKLGSKGVGELAWDEGSVNWSILLSGSNVIVLNATKNFGRLCYDPDIQTITTYKSVTGTNLKYPQIFALTETAIVYPTSISISGKTEVSIGRSTTLTVDYLPKNANTISETVWSSSDETIATVKNGVVTGIGLGTATITAKTKSKNDYLEATFDIEVKDVVLDSWTIMLYICGSNLEEDAAYATADIAEILSVAGQPDDVNIIMECGGATTWHGYGIDGSKLSRYHAENRNIVLDEKLSYANMGKQSTLESFLNWGLENYPAEKTGLIYWNHGGALDGVCFDDIGGSDALTNSERKGAYENVFTPRGIDKLEFVGYDACIMQFQDAAEFDSHYFNYSVGSEESEAGEGWAYSGWIDDVYAGKDTPTILKANCDSFIASVGDDQTLSYLDLSKMADYFTKFEALAAAMANTVNSNYSTFTSVLKTVKDYGGSWWYSGLDSYGMIDGLDCLNKLGNNTKFASFKNQINEVKAAYNALVAYSKIGPNAGNSNGLCFIAAVSIDYPASETNFNNWRALFR